jgi:hypothetical protein
MRRISHDETRDTAEMAASEPHLWITARNFAGDVGREEQSVRRR